MSKAKGPKLGNKALIITAREMNKFEHRRYEKRKSKEMSISKASDFFDEHGLFEFEDVKEVKDIEFKLQKKIYIGLGIELFRKIRREAKKLLKSEDLLIKEWFAEKVK